MVCTADGPLAAADGALIVEFPSRSRRPSSASTGDSSPKGAMKIAPSAPKPKPQPRSVRFAETSSMTLVAFPSPSEARRRWYSEPERGALKLATLRDVRRISQTLATTPLERIGQEELFLCIGVESMLAPDLHRLIRERKRQHVRSCLVFQARQELNGAVDAEELRRHSEASSEWTRTRARKLAAGYWLCLKEDLRQLASPS